MRTAYLNLHLTKDEKEKIRDFALSNGSTMSAYCKFIIFNYINKSNEPMNNESKNTY